MEELKPWPKWLRRGARETLTRDDYVDRLKDVERRLHNGPRIHRAAHTHPAKGFVIEETEAEFKMRAIAWRRAEKKFRRMLQKQIELISTTA